MVQAPGQVLRMVLVPMVMMATVMVQVLVPLPVF
jgi:hypothetical protein